MKKNMIKQIVMVLVVAMVFIGCAKKPEMELNNAQAALTAAMEEGANKYAKDEAKALNDELQAALDEMKVQEGKIFKNYDKTKEMLAKVNGEADALKAKIPAIKEQAKNDAQAAADAAKASIEEAKALLAKAPRGKGSRADIEMMKADVTGLEASLAEVQTLIDTEEYFLAADKANVIKTSAAGVIEAVNQAFAKTGKKN